MTFTMDSSAMYGRKRMKNLSIFTYSKLEQFNSSSIVSSSGMVDFDIQNHCIY
jgi:hypothetical protein